MAEQHKATPTCGCVDVNPNRLPICKYTWGAVRRVPQLSSVQAVGASCALYAVYTGFSRVPHVVCTGYGRCLMCWWWRVVFWRWYFGVGGLASVFWRER